MTRAIFFNNGTGFGDPWLKSEAGFFWLQVF